MAFTHFHVCLHGNPMQKDKCKEWCIKAIIKTCCFQRQPVHSESVCVALYKLTQSTFNSKDSNFRR